MKRLPLDHPEYRYSEAKNPYSARLKEFPEIAYSDNETETHAGKWRTRFPEVPGAKNKELHVEIGCNTGHVTRAWAEAHPNRLHIGIDWKFKIIHRGAEKTAAKGLKNLIFLRANVERLRYMFGEGEIDALYLFFPDPWPKKAQWKNRFLKASTLRDAARVVKPGGLFFIKTDHDGYFEKMCEAFEECKDLWKVEKITKDLHAGNPNAKELKIPDVTLFERLFIKDGIPIKAAWLQRK